MKKIEKLEIYRKIEREGSAEQFDEMWSNLSRGKREVIWSYLNPDKYLTDELVLTHIWASYMQEILDFLKEIGVNKFVFADRSTEAFASIQILIKNGCKLSNIDYQEDFSGIKTGIMVEIA